MKKGYKKPYSQYIELRKEEEEEEEEEVEEVEDEVAE